MPWTPAQMRSIQARAHGWRGPGAFENVSLAKAKEMATEGTKPGPRKKSKTSRQADALARGR